MMSVQARRRLWLPEMEGAMARWYAKQRSTPSQISIYRQEAAKLAAGLRAQASVLEVAPGPGYQAIELARLGFKVTALDISRTFVQIGAANARDAGVAVDFRLGDAAAMPFDSESFDLIVCQAAFKNFRRPLDAINEMYRLLHPGGRAVIQDMRKEATGADIDAEVAGQRLGLVNGLITRQILRGLRRRAYSVDQLERLAAASAFGRAVIHAAGIGVEVVLTRQV